MDLSGRRQPVQANAAELLESGQPTQRLYRRSIGPIANLQVTVDNDTISLRLELAPLAFTSISYDMELIG